MADNQQTDRDEIVIKGGWQRPAQTGGWQQVEPEAEESSGWTVPAMPVDLTETPSSEGIWHLPRPEDTPFAPDDQLVIGTGATEALRPEDMLLQQAATPAPAAAPVEEAEVASDLESFTGLADLVVQLMDRVDSQPKPDILLEETASDTQVEFDDTSLPEREVLSQAAQAEATGEEATELHPGDYARQQLDWLASDRAEEQDTAGSAEDYARQQLAALEADAAPPAPAATGAELDPAEIARQQIAKLSGEEAPAPAAPDPEAELAAKFRDTEQKVRTLRQQYQNGQMTREELQTSLRDYLILDNNEQWWMMGVDTNTWYRYDNAMNDWMIDTPPVSLAAGGPRTATSEFTPEQVLQGNLPYLPEDEEPVAYGVDEFTPAPSDTQPFDTQGSMPLPQAVPTFDPDRTMVGQAAIDQDTVLGEAARDYAAQTVRATPVDVSSYLDEPYQPAYEGAQAVPSYEDLDDESRIYQQAVERQRQSNLRRLALLATLVIGGVFIVGTILVLYMVITYNGRANLYRDDVDGLANYSPPFQSVKIFDLGGDMIAEIGTEQGGARTSIDLEEMSPDLIYAIVGAQDRSYFSRPGFDALAVAGAFLQNFQGGSGDQNDITRQVAQMIINNSDSADVATSLDQVVVASEITRQYGRNFVLELWLNNESFGNQAFGVEAAAEFYFDKTAEELNLTEGSMLVALMRDEIANDPVPPENRQSAFAAADQVLRELASVGCLNFTHPEVSGGQYCVPQSTILRNPTDFSSPIVLERAELQTVEYRPRSAQGDHPHFTDYVRRQLIAEYGDQIFRDGFQVFTTLDPRIQTVAEDALEDQLAQMVATGLQTGAVMVVNPADGAVLAMVGSPDFNDPSIDGQTNNVLTWQLPGATMLPILYTAALEGRDVNGNGALDFNEYLTPATNLFDLPPEFQDPRFQVVNGDSQFRGAVSLRSALANHLKPPAVTTYQYVGAERYVQLAANMGLRFSNDPPIVDLGTAVGMTTDARLYDMMQAYSVLANTGQYVPIRTIRGISTAENQTIPLTENLNPQPRGAVNPAIAFLIQNILTDQSFFDGQFAPLFLPGYENRVVARLNYLNDLRDMWAMGFSRNAVVGVWMGRPDDRATTTHSRDAALPVWQTVMQAALQNSSPAPFNQVPASIASNVTTARVCSATGVNASTTNCAPQRNEFFAVSHPPPNAQQDQDPVVTALIDGWTQQLANEFCQENVIEQQFTRLIPRDPGAIQWLNSNVGRTIATRMGLPIPVQEAPTANCQANTDIPVAVIASPPDNGPPVSGTIQILGMASASGFGSYQLEIAPINTQNFQRIAGPINIPQNTQNSVLAEWNTTTVPNGQYTLRLSMFSQNGVGVLRRQLTITVQNQPTPTPTLSVPPTVPVIATDTTIPLFPSSTPFTLQTFGDATPTPTITIGG